MSQAALFPGQGAQEVGMGRAFHDRYPAARAAFEEADEVLGESLSQLVFEGPPETLTRTDHAQAAIYVTSVAAVRGLEEAGEFDRAEFGAAAGLSLGEYSALWFAGVFSFADGLRLVKRRGVAMQEASDASPSSMVSLMGADRALAEKVCDAARDTGVLVVANLNSPGQVVVSGDVEACGRVPEAAKSLGVRRARPLTVAGAFHSPLMEPAREALEQALADTPLSDPKIPVYANVDAAPVTSADRVRALLARQVVSPVLWEQSMQAMVEDGFDTFVEPPPGTVLAGLMRKIAKDATVRALEPGT